MTLEEPKKQIAGGDDAGGDAGAEGGLMRKREKRKAMTRSF